MADSRKNVSKSCYYFGFAIEKRSCLHCQTNKEIERELLIEKRRAKLVEQFKELPFHNLSDCEREEEEEAIRELKKQRKLNSEFFIPKEKKRQPPKDAPPIPEGSPRSEDQDDVEMRQDATAEFDQARKEVADVLLNKEIVPLVLPGNPENTKNANYTVISNVVSKIIPGKSIEPRVQDDKSAEKEPIRGQVPRMGVSGGGNIPNMVSVLPGPPIKTNPIVATPKRSISIAEYTRLKNLERKDPTQPPIWVKLRQKGEFLAKVEPKEEPLDQNVA